MTYLKAEIAPSPFTSANNVDECMKAEVDEEKKNKHLYIEVMYAKMTKVQCFVWKKKDLKEAVPLTQETKADKLRISESPDTSWSIYLSR